MHKPMYISIPSISTGPLPCFEAIEESQLLESLYSFQQQRAQQEREQQQKRRDGEKASVVMSCVDGYR